MTRDEAIKILKSKMDGSVDTSYEWVEAVRMAIEALKAQTGLISKQDAIEIIRNRIEKSEVGENEKVSEIVVDKMAEPKTGECKTCKRSSSYRWSIGENNTRCPIEEHYALPKDGYCHLYEPYREDGE